MTIAYYCVFILMFIPVLCAGYAKAKGGFTKADNKNTRDFFAKATGVASRANAAQQNSYEVYPVFAAAVIIAHLTGGTTQPVIDTLAVLFVMSRIAFCVCYIADWSLMRSLVWIFGFACTAGLFIAAI
ncbi:MAG: MAPEG family protein [Gammaproteobacteria bacterium]|nr:MAPEG family protein [Gammaproteobacteria bacterium]